MCTRVFVNKPFNRFARKNGIDDAEMCRTVQDADRGLIDADLGGGVIKQRIARKGGGKSGGFRTLIVFRLRDLAVFVHGFAKNEAENIRSDELIALRKLASVLLAYEEGQIAEAVRVGALREVQCDGKREAIS
jgi:hypothetical protein